MLPGAAEPEVPLSGGRLTPGVMKVGETVRRRRASRVAAMFLSHLTSAGFQGAPRYLGEDDLGREILSFIPGDVPAKWRAFADEQVAQAGILLRRLHDASRDLAERLGGGDVVCHHDPGPNNTVFRDGLPVAFIDFDFAAVGDPLEDVGYMAWSWCISSKPTRGLASEQAYQVRVLADAYGLWQISVAGCRRPLRNALSVTRASGVSVLITGKRFTPVPAQPRCWRGHDKRPPTLRLAGVRSPRRWATGEFRNLTCLDWKDQMSIAIGF